MLAEHLLSYAAHRFVGVSEETVEDVVRYERIPRRKVVMIPNGVDGAPFRCSIDAGAKRRELGLPAEGPLLGVGARLVPEKGLEDLIEAVRLLRTGFPTLRLLIAGSGPLEDSLQELAQQRGVADAVHLLGVRHDMPELLRLFDVYVLSSLREGLPMGLLEAMAAECPVVATRVGGIPSVIEDGVNGLLAPPRDPEALAAAIETLLVDKALRSSFSERSRALFDREYGVEQMVRRYESLYLESAPRGALTSR
jgi:glycosyltransferase involved in cell wall biosynthesis